MKDYVSWLNCATVNKVILPEFNDTQGANISGPYDYGHGWKRIEEV